MFWRWASRTAEGIANRSAQAGGVSAAEFEVVVNKIEVSLRANEDVGNDVELDSASNMPEEMIRADKVSAGEKTASDEILVEADAFAADSGLQFCRGVLS